MSRSQDVFGADNGPSAKLPTFSAFHQCNLPRNRVWGRLISADNPIGIIQSFPTAFFKVERIILEFGNLFHGEDFSLPRVEDRVLRRRTITSAGIEVIFWTDTVNVNG